MGNPNQIYGWNLIKEGRYQEAYDVLSVNLKIPAESEEIILANRALCLLLLNRFEDAFNDYKRIIFKRPNTDFGYIGAGIALILLNNYWEGIHQLQDSFHARYADAAGGILAPAFILYAATKLQDRKLEAIALQRLQKLWTPRIHRIWPGAIAGFLLHEIDENELINLATNKNQTLENRRLTQSYFWVAMRHSSENGTIFLRYLQLSGKGHILEFERFLANKELSAADD
jgi:tetratricopeptide (TPR) repeat protein